MIHPSAVISSTARLASGVAIGPCAIIEEGVVMGEGCRIEAHGQVLKGTVMGARNVVGRGAVIGGDPQALSFDPAVESGVRIGEGNTFREHVTVHRSTQPGGQTVLGSCNYLMASSHVGHDAVLGDHNVLANGVLVAGHIVIGSRCFFGGGAALHQFIRVGDYAMVQGCGGYTKDIPPFCTVFRWNNLRGLNVVGLRRAGFDREARRALKLAWGAVYGGAESPVKAAQAALAREVPPEARKFYEFIAAAGPKGVACYRARRSREEEARDE
jgi:UDP-N-acetylglucosamine acyltransferase